MDFKSVNRNIPVKFGNNLQQKGRCCWYHSKL